MTTLKQKIQIRFWLSVAKVALALWVLNQIPEKPAFAMSGFSLERAFGQPDLRWLEDFAPDLERSVHIDEAFLPVNSLPRMIDGLLRDQGLHPFVEIRESRGLTGPNTFLLPLAKSSGEERPIKLLNFYLSGRRIVGYSVKAAALATSGGQTGVKLSVLGSIPRMDESSSMNSLQLSHDWPDKIRSLELALDTLHPGSNEDFSDILDRSDGSVDSPVLITEEVFTPAGNQLRPAWRFVLTSGSLPYEVISDTREVLSFRPLFFDAAASARVYSTSKSDGTLADFNFTITDGQSNLTNSRFRTDLGYSGQSRATAGSGNKFDFATSSRQFQEASVFSHVNAHADYLDAAGFSWNPSQAMMIYVGECYDPAECGKCAAGSECAAKSNAVYVPADSRYSGNPPSIRVAEGDGILLKDLHSSSGVTSHEFGHHVVFSAITEYSEGTEALQLHEGLADALVMMRADSPCLGSGICPSGSRLCYTAQCLRTADNDMTYGSAEYRAVKDHQRGQVISGFLWDLKESGISNVDVVKLTLGALALMPSKSTFGDFLAAIKKADETLFAAANTSTIDLKALARNLNASPLTDKLSDSSSSEKKSRKSSGNIFGCTMMTAGISSGIHVHPTGTTVDNPVVYGKFDTFLALLIALPIALALKSLLRRSRRN
jgi:hypothetical protein